MDGWSLLGHAVQVLFWGGVPAFAVAVAIRPATARRVERFARARQVPVTPQTVRLLGHHLTRVRRYRNVGGAVGWLAGSAVTVATGSTWVFHGGIAGYLAGAIVAELRAGGPGPADGTRRAELLPRTARGYLSVDARFAPPVLLAITAVALVGHLVWPGAGTAATVASAAAVPSILAVILAARRQVLGRPRPVLPDPVRAADDAARASTAQAITGTGIALMCLAVIAVVRSIAPSQAPPAVGFVRGFVALVLGVFALVSWYDMRSWARPVTHPGVIQ